MADDLNVSIPANVTMKIQLERVLSYILPTVLRNEIKEMYKSDPRSALAQYISKRKATVEHLFAMDLPGGLHEKHRARSNARYQTIKNDPRFKEIKRLQNRRRTTRRQSNNNNSSQVTTESNESGTPSQRAPEIISKQIDSGVQEHIIKPLRA